MLKGVMVRYVDQTTASVWVEFGRPQAVILTVLDLATKKFAGRRHVVQTTRVGDRYYAIPYVTHLKPGRLYRYCIEHLDISRIEPAHRPSTAKQLKRHKGAKVRHLKNLALRRNARPVFRTQPEEQHEIARLAVGSCRKWQGGAKKKLGQDTLALFSGWLESTKLRQWPQYLLLVGDQIYADDVPETLQKVLVKRREKLAGQGQPLAIPTSLASPVASKSHAGVNEFHLVDFEEFAQMYQRAWGEEAVQKVFANLATYMIFDDHDITDDWNITGGWVEQMQATAGWRELIVDGLAAYWVYQGWGNLSPVVQDKHPLTRILEDYAGKQDSALVALRKLLLERLIVEAPKRLLWDFRIPSSPPVYVMDSRNDRVLKPPRRDKKTNKIVDYASDEDKIVSSLQIERVIDSVKDSKEPIILVSGTPVIMPLSMALAMFLAARPTTPIGHKFQEANAAETWEELVRRDDPDLDQWPAFPSGLQDFFGMNQALRDNSERERVLVLLSGDVHFSYAMKGRFAQPKKNRGAKMPLVIQLVASPLQNQLKGGEQEKITKLLSRVEHEEMNPNSHPTSGFVSLGFNSVAKAAKRWVSEGILYGDSITTVEFGKDRGWIRAIWYSSTLEYNKLVRAATVVQMIPH